MAVAFIQGASRGIGLEFARALSARGNVKVVAGCRDPDSAEQLHKVVFILGYLYKSIMKKVYYKMPCHAMPDI